MENIKNNYTNFILTVIAVVMMGILFKDNVITDAKAEAFQQDFDILMKEHRQLEALIKNTGTLIKNVCS